MRAHLLRWETGYEKIRTTYPRYCEGNGAQCHNQEEREANGKR